MAVTLFNQQNPTLSTMPSTATSTQQNTSSIPFDVLLGEMNKVVPQAKSVSPLSNTTLPTFEQYAQPYQKAATDYFGSLVDQYKNQYLPTATDLLTRKLGASNAGAESGIGSQNIQNYMKDFEGRVIPMAKEISSQATMNLFPQYQAAQETSGFSPLGVKLADVEADRNLTLKPLNALLDKYSAGQLGDAETAIVKNRFETMQPIELKAKIDDLYATGGANIDIKLKEIRDLLPAQRQAEVDDYVAKADAQRKAKLQDLTTIAPVELQNEVNRILATSGAESDAKIADLINRAPVERKAEIEDYVAKAEAARDQKFKDIALLAPKELEAEINRMSSLSKQEMESELERLRTLAPEQRKAEIEGYVAKAEAARQQRFTDITSGLLEAEATQESKAKIAADAAEQNMSVADYTKTFINPVRDSLAKDYEEHPERYSGVTDEREVLIGAFIDRIIAGDDMNVDKINQALGLKGLKLLDNTELEQVLGKDSVASIDFKKFDYENFFKNLNSTNGPRWTLREEQGFEHAGQTVKDTANNRKKLENLYKEDPIYRTMINDFIGNYA